MYSEDEKRQLLEHIWGDEGTNNILESCRQLKIAHPNYYNWLKEPKFAELASAYKKSFRQSACSFWLTKSEELYNDPDTPPGTKYNLIALNLKVFGAFDADVQDVQQTKGDTNLASGFWESLKGNKITIDPNQKNKLNIDTDHMGNPITE